MEKYHYGIRQEDRLAGALSALGYTTGYSPGSRGPADLSAERGGRRLLIQVKAVATATRRIKNNDNATAWEVMRERMSNSEFIRLHQMADRAGRMSAAALANGDRYWLWVRYARGEYELLHHDWLSDRLVR